MLLSTVVRRISLLGIAALLLATIGATMEHQPAATTANTVIGKRLSRSAVGAATAAQLAPPLCQSNISAANLAAMNVILGANGDNNNNLIINSNTGGSRNGNNGVDCMVGGDGVDTFNGGGGNDVLIGAGGNDSLTGGAQTDICDGGTGTDTSAQCETNLNIP